MLPRSSGTAWGAPVFVWTAWGAMVAAAIAFVGQYGTAMPSLDDLTQVGALEPGAPLGWGWIWSQHNEHRIPIPRLLYQAVVKGTGDFRTGTWLDVGLLAALAAACIRGARAIRGRSGYADAFFPLLLLHWGHAENLLNSFQLQVVLSTVLSGAVLLAIACGPAAPTARSIGIIAACAVLLPLCGMFGVLQVPALAAWLAFVGLRGRGAADPAERRTARIALAGAAGAVLAAGSTLVGLEMIETFRRPGPGRAIATAAQFLAQSFGAPARDAWPWSGWAIAILVAATAAMLLRVARRDPTQRVRALGLLAFLAAMTTFALGVGWGRGMDQAMAGFLSRYGLLSALAPAAAFLAWLRCAPGEAGRFVRATLCALALLVVPLDAREGLLQGEERVQAASELERDVVEGVPIHEIAKRHWRRFYYGENDFMEVLYAMQRLHLGPFPALPTREAPEVVPQFPMMETEPVSASSPRPVFARDVEGESVLIVHADGEVRFAIPDGAREASGRFGLRQKEFTAGPPGGVRFTVEVERAGERPIVLFERVLDARQRADDRGKHSFEVELPKDVRGELVLRTRKASEADPDVDWSYWTDVEVR